VKYVLGKNALLVLLQQEDWIFLKEYAPFFTFEAIKLTANSNGNDSDKMVAIDLTLGHFTERNERFKINGENVLANVYISSGCRGHL